MKGTNTRGRGVRGQVTDSRSVRLGLGDEVRCSGGKAGNYQQDRVHGNIHITKTAL